MSTVNPAASGWQDITSIQSLTQLVSGLIASPFCFKILYVVEAIIMEYGESGGMKRGEKNYLI